MGTINSGNECVHASLDNIASCPPLTLNIVSGSFIGWHIMKHYTMFAPTRQLRYISLNRLT